MRAVLDIPYKRGAMATALASLYGPHDTAALAESALAKKAPKAAKSIVYAARTQGLIVMAERVGSERAVVYVESSGGKLREGAERVWSDIRGMKKALKPKLERLVLFDEAANDDLATAGVGVGAGLRREDLLLSIATGVIAALVVAGVTVFGEVSADLIYGSLPAIGVAILSLINLILRYRSKEMVWR